MRTLHPTIYIGHMRPNRSVYDNGIPNGSGLFKQENAHCITTKIVQVRFMEHERVYSVDLAFTSARSQSEMGCVGKNESDS